MRNSLYLPIASMFIVLLCMGTQCEKDAIEHTYNFVEKVDLYPAQKSYKVGDTIWLEYRNAAKMLFDTKTKQNILADSVGIGFQISFNSRMYKSPVNPLDGFCDFISANGINVNRHLDVYGTGIYVTSDCKAVNNLDFKVGVVPRHTGYYSLDLTGVPKYVSSCPNRISGFPLSDIVYRFNLADCNKDVYLSIPENYRRGTDPGQTERQIDNKEIFALKVE